MPTPDGMKRHELNEAAAAYARMACETLSRDTCPPEQLESAQSEFRVHFLFPNLSESERFMLLALWWSRGAIRVANANEVRQTIVPKLSAIQREIVESEFLTL